MTRRLAAPLLALGLVLTAGCSERVSGDSNPDNQTDQVPAEEGVDDPEELRSE